MKRYYVENGVIVINKYAVKYDLIQSTGKTETASEIVQYFSDDLELGGLISELESKDIDFELIELDTRDILRYGGICVNSEEEARRLVEPSLEEVVSDKLKEISDACKETIYKGVDVELKDGSVKHFSLKLEDQMNINALLNHVSLGNIKAEDGVPYHADGELCRLFCIEDFTLVCGRAEDFILRETAYCNHLMAFVRSLETKEDVEKVFYGHELTGEFLKSYSRIAGGADEAENGNDTANNN